MIEEEAELRGDLFDWKAKFVELWKQVNIKDSKEPRRNRVSCNPNFVDEGFGARRDSGSGVDRVLIYGDAASFSLLRCTFSFLFFRV